MYACLHPAHLHCGFLNCWYSEFKASPFSSIWKHTNLHLFFLPALFGWPHLYTCGDKTISNSKVQKHLSNLVLMEHLNSFYFFFLSVGEDFETNLEHGKAVQVQVRFCYWQRVSCQVDGSILVLCEMSFILFCVLRKSLLAPRKAVCVQCLMLPLNPKGKPSRPKALPPWLHCGCM